MVYPVWLKENSFFVIIFLTNIKHSSGNQTHRQRYAYNHKTLFTLFHDVPPAISELPL